MEVTTQSELEAFGVILAKYPMLFAANNSFDSLMNSLYDADLMLKQFGGKSGTKLVFARNLTGWIMSLRDDLAALGISTVEMQPLLAADSVILVAAGADEGTWAPVGDGTWTASYTDSTWASGIRINDVYSDGTVAFADDSYTNGY